MLGWYTAILHGIDVGVNKQNEMLLNEASS